MSNTPKSCTDPVMTRETSMPAGSMCSPLARMNGTVATTCELPRRPLALGGPVRCPVATTAGAVMFCSFAGGRVGDCLMCDSDGGSHDGRHRLPDTPVREFRGRHPPQEIGDDDGRKNDEHIERAGNNHGLPPSAILGHRVRHISPVLVFTYRVW